MVSKAEKEKILIKERREKLAAKSLKEIDNKWEALAFIWAFRQREIKNLIIVVQTAVIIIFTAKYTTVVADIYNIIKGFFK